MNNVILRKISFTPLENFKVPDRPTNNQDNMSTVKYLITNIAIVILIVLPIILLAIGAAEGRGVIILFLAAGIFSVSRIITIIYRIRTGHKAYASTKPIAELAQVNSWGFYSGEYTPELRGYFFRQSVQRTVWPIITIHANNLFDGQGQLDFGNFYFTKKPRHKYDAEKRGFIGLTLSHKIPHIIITGRASSFTDQTKDLTKKLKSTQKFTVAYAFDQRYDVYVPNDYGRDAYEILTPDFMELLLKFSEKYNFEIIDNRLYIYKNTPFDLFNKEQYLEILETTLTIAAKIDERVAKYYDWRATNLGVSGPVRTKEISEMGRRLQLSLLGKIKIWLTVWWKSIDQRPFLGTILTLVIISIVPTFTSVILGSLSLPITIILAVIVIGRATRVWFTLMAIALTLMGFAKLTETSTLAPAIILALMPIVIIFTRANQSNRSDEIKKQIAKQNKATDRLLKGKL